MFDKRPFLSWSLVLFSMAAFGQTGNTVLGAAYSFPAPINAAPGQILNLLVQGVGATLTQPVAATNLPLPAVLAGISVQVKQAFTPQSITVPLIAVRPVSTCLNGTPACGHYVVLTVEMPFELVPNLPCGPCDPPPVPNAQLVVSENGLAGGAIDVSPVADQVHVADLCDIDTGAPPACGSTPLITHADGSLISVSSPARPGEEVVIYALGLGATKPTVPTGQATPSPAPVAQTVGEVWVDFQANAGPSKGVPLMFTVCYTSIICPFTPVFAGLTPGSVGLYQVNFIIPSAPLPTFACGNGINSNLTLTIVGTTSFDGAGICVATSTSGTAGAASSSVAVQATASADAKLPFGPFLPNTMWFPIGLAGLGPPLPAISGGVPGASAAAK